MSGSIGLKEVVEATWKKEPELKDLKDELLKLDRQIQLSLKPIEESESQSEKAPENTLPINRQPQSNVKTETTTVQDAPMPTTIQGVKEVMGDRFVIGSVETNPPKEKVGKGLRL